MYNGGIENMVKQSKSNEAYDRALNLISGFMANREYCTDIDYEALVILLAGLMGIMSENNKALINELLQLSGLDEEVSLAANRVMEYGGKLNEQYNKSE